MTFEIKSMSRKKPSDQLYGPHPICAFDLNSDWQFYLRITGFFNVLRHKIFNRATINKKKYGQTLSEVDCSK